MADLLGSLREAGAHEQAAALADRAAAHASLDDPDAVAVLLDSLREAGAHEQVTALLARAAAHAPLDDPDGVAILLDSLRRGGRAGAGRPRWLTAPPPTPPSTTRAPWPACWTACGRRARTSRPPRWPTAPPPTPPSTTRARVADLLDSLREAGAHEQVTALAGPRSAAHAALDDPAAVASPAGQPAGGGRARAGHRAG